MGEQLGQVDPRRPIKTTMVLQWQRASELEHVIPVLLVYAAVRQARSLPGRVHMKTSAVWAQNSPHASQSEAAHLPAVRQRPSRNMRARGIVENGFPQTVRAARPYAGKPQAPGLCVLSPKLSPHFHRAALQSEGNPKPGDTELKKDWAENFGTALVARCFKGLCGQAPRSSSVHCEPCVFLPLPRAGGLPRLVNETLTKANYRTILTCCGFKAREYSASAAINERNAQGVTVRAAVAAA